MVKHYSIIRITIFIFCFFLPLTTYAHGVEITYQTVRESMEITCRYDDGTVLAGATVDIFAPNDPVTPWISGLTDSNGHYVFTPNISLPGEWAVRVRIDGHGGLAYIPVAKASFFTPERILQLVLALAAAIFTLSAFRYLKRKNA